MEVKELVSFYINESLQTLDVTFRLTRDSDEVIRTDQIDLEEAEKLGYNFDSGIITENYEEDDDFDEVYDDINVDDEEIKSFLNDYYFENLKRLPKPELF
jgi:hypothetical protein